MTYFELILGSVVALAIIYFWGFQSFLMILGIFVIISFLARKNIKHYFKVKRLIEKGEQSKKSDKTTPKMRFLGKLK